MKLQGDAADECLHRSGNAAEEDGEEDAGVM
jgi:hypothetical protein